jgi:mannose-1-phosphate guanylyltransferase
MRRDSGPAAAVAPCSRWSDREALALVLAADHVIQAAGIRDACRRAAAGQPKVASSPRIELYHPATNYGYIRPGAQLNGASGVRSTFVEKPDIDSGGYVADHYLWNSGNFLFHAATMLGEIERLEPDMAAAARLRAERGHAGSRFPAARSRAVRQRAEESIDYAVMERTKLAAVVPADLGWSDIGSWSTVWEVLDHDAAGNAIDGGGDAG